MNKLNQIYNNLQLRNKNITEPLKSLKAELESCFSEKLQEAGVIDRGYYSYFLPILEKYRVAKLITKFHITEEQYTDSYSGNLIKVPCVDLFATEDQTSSIRLFITPFNLFKI